MFYRYLQMRFLSYLASAKEVLQQYKGDLPFAAWLKNYFREHKKFGSRDRKLVADLCFCYFRLGKAFSNLSVEEKLLVGQFLCHDDSPFVTNLKPAWQDLQIASLPGKLSFLQEDEIKNIFPFWEAISPEIEREPFVLSFLQQPDLFLRIRPGKEENVLKKLTAAGIPFTQEGACLQLANSTKIDEIITVDEEAVIQDISSQKVLLLLQHKTITFRPQATAWDCCAASGGKTILLHDAYPEVKLTVSDIRESIIVNLKNRLKRAGVEGYRFFVADISSTGFIAPQKFDIIVCDAPCSGSGTWSRAPDQLSFFKEEKISYYAGLQKNIASNASRSLKKGGAFLYITCSVFTAENEAVVAYMQQHTEMKLVTQQYFKGFDRKGDTLFAALFTA